jgi:mono/diheme cytochrome c family protein
MFATLRRFAVLIAATAALPAAADPAQVEHGRYLVTIMGCTDCHTPGHFLGQPDMARFLGGSDVGFEIPGLGTFYGPNLTPDPSGLGGWSPDEIVAAIRTGVRPDGSPIAPAMPWMGYSALTDADAQAIAAFLGSLPPVAHEVPGPFAPGVAPGGLVMAVAAR